MFESMYNCLTFYCLLVMPYQSFYIVVWNPWEKKTADFGDAEYKKMVCVDGAAIERPITLKPGEEWTGRLELEVVHSSFCSEKVDYHLKHF